MRHRSFAVRVVVAAAVALAVGAPVVSGSLSFAAAGKVYDGPDVSSYQHPNPTAAHPHGQPINWKAVAKSGKEFAIVKATEGLTYTNPDFNGPYFHDYGDAAAAGLVHGSYHFAQPAFPIVKSAIAQAKRYAKIIGPVRTKATLPPALDLEATGGLSSPQLVTWAQTFLLKLRAITGRTPMLYTYQNFWDYNLADPKAFARFPLWMAHYGTQQAPVSDLWQYTSTAHIHGIAGRVDVSRFVGSHGLPWSTLSNGTLKTPWSPAAPGAPVTPVATLLGNTATISWHPGDPGTRRVTSYSVIASPGGRTQTVSGATFSTRFTGLKPRTTYTFTVRGVNSVDIGTPSKPTNAVTPTIPTGLSATAPASLQYGADLPLRVTLRRSDTKAALGGRTILVFRRPNAAASWHQIRKLSTNKSGVASTVIRPKRSAQLEMVFPGATGIQSSTTYRNYVVRPGVTAALSSSSVVHGGQVTESGAVTPFEASQKVQRQRRVNGVWKVFDTTKVDKLGHFSFTVRPKVAAVYVDRIVVLATARRGEARSTKMRLTVT